MYHRILKVFGALALTLSLATVAHAQQDAHAKMARDGSWEFSLGGGVMFLGASLTDFLGRGSATSRFANDTSPIGRIVPTGVARLGYNINPNFGFSVSAGLATVSGVTFLNPTAAITYTGNLNARTSPFLMVGTELTRIDGGNGTRTHSTYGAHVGVGVRHMVTEHTALRLEGREQIVGYDEIGMRRRRTFSPVVTLGLSLFTHGRNHPAMVMAPMHVDTVRTVRVETVRMVRVDTLRIVRRDTLTLPAEETADQVVLRVQFQTGRTELLPISIPVLNTIATAIKATPASHWKVEGHTDSIGGEALNKRLSLGRAQAVVDYLVSQGVDRNIMEAVGYAYERPVFSNTTAAGRAENRRVQLRRRPIPPTVVVP